MKTADPTLLSANSVQQDFTTIVPTICANQLTLLLTFTDTISSLELSSLVLIATAKTATTITSSAISASQSTSPQKATAMLCMEPFPFLCSTATLAALLDANSALPILLFAQLALAPTFFGSNRLL